MNARHTAAGRCTGRGNRPPGPHGPGGDSPPTTPDGDGRSLFLDAAGTLWLLAHRDADGTVFLDRAELDPWGEPLLREEAEQEHGPFRFIGRVP